MLLDNERCYDDKEYVDYCEFECEYRMECNSSSVRNDRKANMGLEIAEECGSLNKNEYAVGNNDDNGSGECSLIPVTGSSNLTGELSERDENEEMNVNDANKYCDTSFFRETEMEKHEVKEMNPYYILQGRRTDVSQVMSDMLSCCGYIEGEQPGDKQEQGNNILTEKGSENQVNINVGIRAVVYDNEIHGIKNGKAFDNIVSHNGALESMMPKEFGEIGFRYNCEIEIDKSGSKNSECVNDINTIGCGINISNINHGIYGNDMNSNGNYEMTGDLEKGDNNVSRIMENTAVDKGTRTQYYHTQIRSSGLDKFTAVDGNGKRSILREVETQAQLMPSIPGVYFDRRQIGYRVRYHNSYIGWVALSRYPSIKDAYEYAKQLWLGARNRSKEGNYIHDGENSTVEKGRRSRCSVLFRGKRNREFLFYENGLFGRNEDNNQQLNMCLNENREYDVINNNSNNSLAKIYKGENGEAVGKSAGVCNGTEDELYFFNNGPSNETLLGDDTVNQLKIRGMSNNAVVSSSSPSRSQSSAISSSSSFSLLSSSKTAIGCFDLKFYEREENIIKEKRGGSRYSALETMKKLYIATREYVEKWPSKDGHYTIHWCNTSDLSLFLYGEDCEGMQRQKTLTRKSRNNKNYIGSIGDNYVGRRRTGFRQGEGRMMEGEMVETGHAMEKRFGLEVTGILGEKSQQSREEGAKICVEQHVGDGNLCGGFGYIW